MIKFRFSKILVFALFWAVFESLPAQSGLATRNQKAIEQLLEDQRLAWNRGDLNAYMLGYWNSDQLVFVGSKGLTKGWESTLANYKKAYPDVEAMGSLTFELLQLDGLGSKGAMVIGKWRLDRKAGVLQGHFMLVLRKFGREWKIIADHSS